MRACVFVCVRACVGACVRACVCVRPCACVCVCLNLSLFQEYNYYKKYIHIE